MSKIGSVHWNPKYRPHLQHNDRTNSRASNIYQHLSQFNECDKSAETALQEIDSLYREAMSILEKSKKKGKRTPKERCYHEAIFEIDKDTTMEECQKLANEIAAMTGFTKIQISIHRDEGHEEEEKFNPHYHAHAVFFTLDRQTGKQLARREQSLNPKNLSKMQDLASEILSMRRGREFFKKGEKSPSMIQNQDDFKRYKDQERELSKKLEEKSKKTIQKVELAKSELSALRRKIEFEKQELAKIQSNHADAFKELEEKFAKKMSFWKNALTFGRYKRKLLEDYENEKQQLTMIAIKAESKASQDLIVIQNQFKELTEYNDKIREELHKEREKSEELRNLNREITEERNRFYKKLYPNANQNIVQESQKQVLNQKSIRR